MSWGWGKNNFFQKNIFFCLIPMTISHNPTNPRNDPWNFHKNILRIDRVEKWPFFESPFWIFFCKKKIFFASSPWKLVPNYVLEWMGLNIQYYDGLQPKIRAGIINEHECRYQVSSISESSEKKNIIGDTFSDFTTYTHAHLWFPPLFLAVNHHYSKNWVPFILTHNLWLIFMRMKLKKIQNGQLKKTE